MGAALFTRFIDVQNDATLSSPGSVDMNTDSIVASLLDMPTAGIVIVSSTNATPIVVTATSHGLANGDRVCIQGHTVNTNANGAFRIANVATNTFELTTDVAGVDVAGNGVGGATGSIMDMELQDFADISGVDAGPIVIGTPTFTGGIFDGSNLTFPSVAAGDPLQGILFYNNTPAGNGDKTLIAFQGSDTVTGLPVTPDGNNINLTFDSGLAKIFMLGRSGS